MPTQNLNKSSRALLSLTVLLSSILFSTFSLAQEANNSSSQSAADESKKVPAFSGSIQMARSTSLNDYQDGTRKDGMDYAARFKFRMTEKYALRLDGSFSQDLRNSDSNDFNDVSITLLRSPLNLGRLFKMGFSLSALVPTSKDSRIRQNLKSAAAAGASLAINPEKLIEGLSIGGGVSVKKNIHEYTTAIDGSVNTEYSSGQSLSIAYQHSTGFGFSFEFIHKNGVTYQNNLKEAFEHTEELGYSLNEALALAVGHTNSGSMLKANGDMNLALINPISSMVYGSVNVAF